MAREIVRNFRAERTHFADVEAEYRSWAFGAFYRKPDTTTLAICGVSISDGVIMKGLSGATCPTCRFAAKRGL